MEAVAAHVILLVELVGHGVEIGVGRHGAVESIVEHGDLRHVGHQGIHGADATQVTGIVNGCEVNEALNALLHLGSDDATLLEEVAALHDAVTDGVDLVEALYGTNLRVEQHFEHQGHTLLMGRQVGHDFLLLAIVEFHFDEGTIDADTLHATLCENTLVGHVVKLVFDR